MRIEEGGLPFYARPDMTPFLIHLTKGRSACSALEKLTAILRTGVIEGTSNFVKGPTKAACFMDVPFVALKHVCSRKTDFRYEPYGVIVTKRWAFKKGARPVLYLPNEDLKKLKVPNSEQWRVVRLEYSSDDKAWGANWLHEREWRCSEYFELPGEIFAALVKTTKDAMELQEIVDKKRDDFKCIPRSIIPLEVVCQGLDT